MTYVPMYQRRDSKPLVSLTALRRNPTTGPAPPVRQTQAPDPVDLALMRLALEETLTQLYGAPT